MIELDLKLPPLPRGTVDAQYTADGMVIDPALPDAPLAPGASLPELHVLHIYRAEIGKPGRTDALIGVYWHPNPETVDAKIEELTENANWHVDRIRYVRSDLVLKVIGNADG